MSESVNSSLSTESGVACCGAAGAGAGAAAAGGLTTLLTLHSQFDSPAVTAVHYPSASVH